LSQEVIVKTKLNEYKVLKDLMYTKTDEWVRFDGDVAIVGITDYAQKKLRFIVNIELPDVGARVSEGDTVATLESVKTIADVYSPVNGEVVAVNEELMDNPDLINKDPYGRGWIVKVRFEGSIGGYRSKLLSYEDYIRKIKEEEG